VLPALLAVNVPLFVKVPVTVRVLPAASVSVALAAIINVPLTVAVEKFVRDKLTALVVAPPPKVIEPDTSKEPDTFDIIIVVAGLFAVKTIPVLTTLKEFKVILGTRVIVELLKPAGMMTSSPANGIVPPDQFAAVVHLLLPFELFHVLVAPQALSPTIKSMTINTVTRKNFMNAFNNDL
jgi:hypothetical protein